METISQSISNFNLSLKFGVLGLETMGRQIAENLIHSGHEVFVFDKYTSHMVGAKSVSPSELIDNAAIIFSCISDPLILQEVSRVYCIISSPALSCLTKYLCIADILR